MLTFNQGDIFSTPADALVQGCNLQGVMDAGVAVQFKERYPDMYEEYKCRCDRGEYELGDLMVWDPDAPEPDGEHVTSSPSTKPAVVNLFTQTMQPFSAYTDPTHLTMALKKLKKLHYDRMVLPLIGGGLGGMDRRDVVEAMISTLQGTDKHFVVASEFVKNERIDQGVYR